VLLFLREPALAELIIEGLEFARLDPAAFSLEEGGDFHLFLRMIHFAPVDVAELVVEGLLTVLEGLLIHLVILLSLLEFEGGDIDLKYRLSG